MTTPELFLFASLSALIIVTILAMGWLANLEAGFNARIAQLEGRIYSAGLQ